MRQTHETATSFNQLKELTQSIQAYKALTQANENANISAKESAQTKKAALKPTKRAFSERQKTTLKKQRPSANARLKTKQGDKQANKKRGQP